MSVGGNPLVLGQDRGGWTTPRHLMPLGEAAWTDPPESQDPPFEEITITGVTDTPDPLAHRLTYSPLEQVRGNAAPLIYRALVMSGGEKHWSSWPEALKVGDQWSDEEVIARQQEIREAVETPLWEELRLAARRTDCVWDFGLDQRPGLSRFVTLLPDLQTMRQFANDARLKARMERLTGDLDAARETIRVTLAVYRHLGRPTDETVVVKEIIAAACTDVMYQELRALMEHPDAPSLYWELVDLPTIPVDMRASIRAELWSVFQVVPALAEVSESPMPPVVAERQLTQVVRELQTVVRDARISPDRLSLAEVPVLFLVMASSRAHQVLIDHGWTDEAIERLPAAQRVLLAEKLWLHAQISTIEGGLNLDYPIGPGWLNHNVINVPFWQTEPIPFGSLLWPAMLMIHSTEVRQHQQIATLRLIEALRLHAGRTGSLPASLDEVTIVPVPRDPFTDKPFVYERAEDGTAIVRPHVWIASYPKPLKITLAK